MILATRVGFEVWGNNLGVQFNRKDLVFES